MALDMRHFISIQKSFIKADHKLAGFISVKQLIQNLKDINVSLTNQMLKFLIVAMYEKNTSDEELDLNQEIDVNGILSFNKL